MGTSFSICVIEILQFFKYNELTNRILSIQDTRPEICPIIHPDILENEIVEHPIFSKFKSV